jgi:hypothetical protein
MTASAEEYYSKIEKSLKVQHANQIGEERKADYL